MNKCKNCGKDCDKTYCCGACKVSYHRHKPVTVDVTGSVTVTKEDVTVTDVTEPVTDNVTALPANFGLPDCACYHCRQNRSQPEARQLTINHGPAKLACELLPNEINRQTLPGDIDYDGVCVQIDGKWIVPESNTISIQA
jgi:hypothetical protein